MPVKWIVYIYTGAAVFFPALALASTCHNDKEFLYANQLVDQEAYTDAAAVYESVLARDSSCMAAKIELGFCHIHLGNYDKATRSLQEARQATLQDKDNPDEASKVRQLIDAQLAQIPQMRQRAAQQQDAAINVQPSAVAADVSPKAQLSVGLGVSDNINGGVQFDELTFGQGAATITQKLSQQSKAHQGTWLDLEVAGQRSVPVPEGLEGNLHVIATWRDAHDLDWQDPNDPKKRRNESEFDLGTLRGMLELKPAGEPSALDPRVVLSGGSFFLDNAEYRDDLAIGGRISQTIADRNVTLGYQFADHNYRTIENTDGRYHRLSLAVPLMSSTGSKKIKLAFDIGHQWPESTGRLGDYRETSGKLRLSLEPTPQSDLSVSYGISKQQDAAAYNRDVFGDVKRNTEQKALNIGWSKEIEKDVSLEANFQHRKHNSDVKLFEHTATDMTVGLRWQLD